ncbi:hypothetical protein [Aestuariispira insulae]|uniref:Uncharacterized protein n=1 Tax=Aestuariispira insulae TaxID=1461337 RepID=A0A3D9H6H1_9PROT|nr:hypothetical protein [Aestuariispira insulae]RED45098.1 hypothetical protein DFP90_11291 [Aestuariispira insulae]
MAVETSSLTLFSQGNVFSTLAGSGLRQSGLSAIARGLRVALDPMAPLGLLNQPVERRGFSADTPALFYHPNNLSLQNFLLLAELNTGLDGGFGDPDAAFSNAMFTLQEFASIDRLPFLLNDAERILMSAPFNTAVQITLTAEALLELQAQAEAEEAAAEAEEAANDVDPRVSDFTKRDSETAVFGSTYSSVATDASLNGQFVRSVGIRTDREILLSDLIERSTTGAATHYAVSVRSALGDSSNGSLLDNTMTEVGDTVVLTAAELSTYYYKASSEAGLDHISIIELTDPGGDGTYDGRGTYQTIAVATGEEENRQTDRGNLTGYSEEYIDLTFLAETGGAVEEVRLEFSGINSLGITDALDAINQGKIMLRVNETLPDGTVNEAVVDLYVSDTNTIVARFYGGFAEDGFESKGINVEIRQLDTSFDISTLEVTAKVS